MRQELRIAKELDDMFNGRKPLYSGDLGYAAQLLRTLVACNEVLEAAQERKPLTDEKIDDLAIDADGLPNSHLEFARAIEAAHGIKEAP